MNKLIKEKALFYETSIRQVDLGEGITLRIGQLKDGNAQSLQSINFEEKTWNPLQIADWMKYHADKVGLGALLPDEAAGLWLSVYNESCIAGMSSDEAASAAWDQVKAKWYQDRNGSWIKFAENWQKAILSNDRPTMEILKVGDYPQFVTKDNPKGTLSEADLDQIVANFDRHNTVPLTVDHQSAGPALGWVDRIWRDGKTLYATMRNLVTNFAKDIKAGKYINRSVEIMPNLSYNGERIGMTLMAVTFLGAITPQVEGMLAPKFAALFARFERNGGGLVMSIDDNPAIYELSKQYLEDKPTKPPIIPKGDTLELNEQQVAELKQKAVDDAVKKLKAENQTAMDEKDQKIKTLETDHEKELNDRDKKIKKFEADAGDRRQKQIKADAEASFAMLFGKGKILPTQKETYIATFVTLSQSEAKVTLADGNEISQAQAYEGSFAALPDKLNLTELTKNSDQTANRLEDQVPAGSTPESIERLKKIYAIMDDKKWAHDDVVKFKQASAQVDREKS